MIRLTKTLSASVAAAPMIVALAGAADAQQINAVLVNLTTDTVTIQGSGLFKSPTVIFDGHSASIVSHSSSTIVAHLHVAPVGPTMPTVTSNSRDFLPCSTVIR